MAQPSSKIAEAFCAGEHGREGDVRLRGDSVSSKNSLDPLTCADREASAQSPQREELAEVSQALAALLEAVTPLAAESRPQLPRLPAGVGGFNIDPPLRSRQIGGPVGSERRSRARRPVISEPSVARPVPQVHDDTVLARSLHRGEATPPGPTPKRVGKRAASARRQGRRCVRWRDRNDRRTPGGDRSVARQAV